MQESVQHHLHCTILHCAHQQVVQVFDVVLGGREDDGGLAPRNHLLAQVQQRSRLVVLFWGARGTQGEKKNKQRSSR